MHPKIKSRNQRRLPVGEIIGGTTKPEDLIPAFVRVAQYLWLNKDDRTRVQRINRRNLDPNNCTEEEQHSDLCILLDLLNDYTPDFCYVGANGGDAASFGCWPNEAIIPFHGRATDDIGRGDCLPSASVIMQDHWLQVNDHGNCTMWRKRRIGKGYMWVECWSLV